MPIIVNGDVLKLWCVSLTIEITEKNMTMPMISSIVASGNKVCVTGPLVLYSLTMDKAGEGAIANAIPPNTNAK